MKGKLFNVRGESPKRILENKEVTEIKQILGIESGKEYTQEIVNTKLRYGKILFMTDQDLDGSHIKGLGINLFDSEWKSLINIPGFIGFMNTPILKAKKGASELKFYNDGEWNTWCSNNSIKGWKIKYYKGLGTSTSKEFKEYFQHKKIVNFVNNDAECNNAIDMVFNKTRANDRKTWLENYDRELYLDTNNTEVTYKNFINREMIHFSKYDCDRSIPNLLDGLKTSQRKILYTAFKRNLTSEIKVAQFSGSVSEISCYHHGENSLNGAIVGMAQDFVGSNNINLLEPKGQFGTRLQGGSDSASERYIHTNLNKLTRNIFTDKDDGILEYIDDDGTLVEPRYYVPIIPMILVNGSKGIGTGFSTDIMCYNPLTIIDYLENSLNDNIEKPDITPYYKNFKGSIIKLTESKWLFKGCYERIGKKEIRVTELPIGLWTDDYKKYIEELIDGNKTTTKGKKKTVIVKDYNDMSTDIVVDVTIIFSSENKLDELINKKIDDNSNELEKLLRLYTTKTTTNMHLFDENEKLKKFKTPMEIIDHYIDIRLNTYVKRKKYLIKLLEHETKILINKVKFIKELLNNTLDLRNKKKIDICEMLKNKDYDIIDDDSEFKYLIRLPMDSVSEENIEILEKNKDIKVKELNKLIKTKEKDIWLSELTTLKTEMIKFLQNKPKTKGGKNTKVKKKLKIKD